MTVRRKKTDQAGGEHEAYETPAWCVRRLLEAERLPAGRWLEPCAATGNIIRAVRDADIDVSWVACEIRKECSEALRDDAGVDSDDVLIGDFFELAKSFPREDNLRRNWAFDVVLTNPPFSMAAEFIGVCRALAPVVVMLLPVPFYGSAGRESFFEEHTPSRIWQLPDRPQFTGGGSNSLEYGWWVWGPFREPPGLRLQRLAVTPPEERGVRARGGRAA